MTTDASDTAVAVTLFRCKKANARDVTKEDLLDPEVCQILGVAYKQLTTSQRECMSGTRSSLSSTR